MLIGNNYSDNKIYRGIRYFDGLPLLSEDLHEYADTVFMKNAYLMNNIIGYGTLNTPTITLSNSGIRLNEPSVVLIDGDVSLIKSDDNDYIVSMSEIDAANYEQGVVCIVGWYQHLDITSTLRNYGGVKNIIIPNPEDSEYNELFNDKFKMQLSTRYQFRWDTCILTKESIDNSDPVEFDLNLRDQKGNLTGKSSKITTYKKVGNAHVAHKPEDMSYALSDLYIVPLLVYKFDKSEGTIREAVPYLPINPKGSSGFVNSNSEPLGEYREGTTWYNPDTREFKIYVEGTGFVSSASTMGFLQYQSVHNITETNQNTKVIPINISEFQEGDILQVVYEGLVLTAIEHYRVNYESQTISMNFDIYENEKVTFTVTKIVEASDITNISATFIAHMNQTGSSTVEAHVKLSDTINDSDASKGIAATPKAVKSAKVLTDSATNTQYTLGVSNGVLYIEEV